jgi:hypothetical protein
MPRAMRTPARHDGTAADAGFGSWKH